MNNHSLIGTNKGFILSVLFLLITLLGISYVMSQTMKPRKKVIHKYPLVQEICGIRPGRMFKKDVNRKYGTGIFVDDEEASCLYYTNTSHSYTLCAGLGPDYWIEYVDITQGLDLPEGSSVKKATSKILPLRPTIEHGIKFNMTKAQVLAILGPPNPSEENMNKESILEYQADYDKDNRVRLYYRAIYEFKDDKLIHINISDGE